MAERIDYSSAEEYAQAVQYEAWAYEQWCAEQEALSVYVEKSNLDEMGE